MELERVVGEPAVLASCVSFARWDSTVWSGGLPGPMKAVVIRNTILIPDSGCKGEGTLRSGSVRQENRSGLQRVLKKGSRGWNSKGRGAKAPPLSYRFFVGLKPHANPKDEGIDFFSNLFSPWSYCVSIPWGVAPGWYRLRLRRSS